MKLITTNSVIDIQNTNIQELLEFKRNNGRDKLCKFEDYLIKKFNFCHWKLENKEILTNEHDLCFLYNNGDITKFNIYPFLTLPTSCDNDILNLTNIWSLYYNEEYYIDTKFDKGDVSLPSGFLHPRYVFIGEAPSKSRLSNESNTYYNTKTRVYTQGKNCLLFRILSNLVFGTKNWYTNIFKCGVFPEDKILDERLDNSLKYLQKELHILNPEFIVCLGNFVHDIICNSNLFKDYRIAKIFHPSYIMRQGNDIDLYRKNMKKVYNTLEK